MGAFDSSKSKCLSFTLTKEGVKNLVMNAGRWCRSAPGRRATGQADRKGRRGNQGRDVTVTLDFSKCTNNDASAAPSSTRGGLKITAFRILANGAIAFSDQHVTIDSKDQPILQILRYQVKPDASVAFTLNTFLLPSYSTIPAVAYTCAVNQGVNFFEESGHGRWR